MKIQPWVLILLIVVVIGAIIAVYFLTRDTSFTETDTKTTTFTTTPKNGFDFFGLFSGKGNKKKKKEDLQACMDEFGGVNYDEDFLDECIDQVNERYA